MSAIDVPRLFGPLLLGGLVASALSGITAIQTLLYFKFYPLDPQQLKGLVVLVWALDTGHTACIWVSLWRNMITDFGLPELVDIIPASVATSIVFTAILTFVVHCFLANRIFLLSQRNWFLTLPIVILAVLRLASASTTCAQMIIQKTYSRFGEKVAWVFTLGLALSTAVDILISASLFMLLSRNRRPGLDRLNATIDMLILYTFETGTITCAATIVSMICWILMPTNLIFLGLHFVIGKLYANSLLVTLNTRRKLRSGGKEVYVDRCTAIHTEPILVLGQRGPSRTMDPTATFSEGGVLSKTTDLQINVERSVEYSIGRSRQSASMIYSPRQKSHTLTTHSVST